LKFNPEKLENILEDSVSNFVGGRTEIDVVYEIMLKMGLDLTYPVEETDIDGKKVYSIGFGALMICLDDNITAAVAVGMAKLYEEKKSETWKVVFKDNGFADDSAKTNVREILKCAGLDEDAFTTL
jgi:adenine-specific DNA-methyltransferase